MDSPGVISIVAIGVCSIVCCTLCSGLGLACFHLFYVPHFICIVESLVLLASGVYVHI